VTTPTVKAVIQSLKDKGTPEVEPEISNKLQALALTS
jgi:hypothetical protein